VSSFFLGGWLEAGDLALPDYYLALLSFVSSQSLPASLELEPTTEEEKGPECVPFSENPILV
jgi:hypothetical protein